MARLLKLCDDCLCCRCCTFCTFLITGRRYNYLFYMDFAGSLSEERVQNALRHLSESTEFLHVLGSYPQLGDSDSDNDDDDDNFNLSFH